MTVIESAVQWAIATANDNSHGYSQSSRSRWGNPDYDCSSFVISAYEQAGLKLREAGASYTGNMRQAFLACGFVDVTTQCGLSSGYGIQAGDVLLNYAAHTCISIGNGKVANCRTDEGHPQTGDQSGNEIRIQAYWNFPWNAILRFKGDKQVTTPSSGSSTTSNAPMNDDVVHNWKPQLLTMSNSYKDDCVALQAILNCRHFACGSADGFFGAKTQAAVRRFQAWAFPDDKAEQDGVVGKKTWSKLLEVEK